MFIVDLGKKNFLLMAEISVKSSNDNQAVDSSESNNANIKSNERPFLFGVHFKVFNNNIIIML